MSLLFAIPAHHSRGGMLSHHQLTRDETRLQTHGLQRTPKRTISLTNIAFTGGFDRLKKQNLRGIALVELAASEANGLAAIAFPPKLIDRSLGPIKMASTP